MISIDALRAKLDGYPESIIQHYEAFLRLQDPDHLKGFVISLIQFLKDAGDSAATHTLPDSVLLREDLGIDSITIAEVVFLLEEIFEIEIDNQDLMSIATVGDLKQYILKKLP